MECIVYLQIENDIRPARVTAIEHPHHLLYHVVFDDGYENLFFTDVETGEWVEEDLGKTSLAAALGTELLPLQHFSSAMPPLKRLTWCRASIAAMVINFGFHSYQENTKTIFEVYSSNQKFLCNLVKGSSGRWVMYGSCRQQMEYQYTNQLHVIVSLLEGMADGNNG